MIKCFVVDDEAHAIAVLTRYIAQTPGLELAGSAENPLEALQAIASGQTAPDLLFVDVDMPQLSGLDLVELVPPGLEVVFTTAFSEYALQAFEQNAVDYLLKPITYERFLKAISKAMEKLSLKAGTAGPVPQEDYIFVKGEDKGKLVKINLGDITYVEAMQNYVKIHTPEAIHVTYLTMKEMEEKLPGDRFLRVHKSFIVQTGRIKSLEGNQVHLEDGGTVTLGASYRSAFLARVNARLVKSKRLP